MTRPKIVIVEDEHIIAMEIQDRLENLGYNVPVLFSSGEEAVKQIKTIKPDLVIMDIMLRGEMDGIEAAEKIQNQLDIPVVYLTAYSDKNTLERAKITQPFGYILKPLEKRELHSTIEIALYKHKIEKKLKENKDWLTTTLKSIGDGVITTDKKGQITFMNAVAQSLTGWKQEEALGEKAEKIINIIDVKSRSKPPDIIQKVLKKGTMVKIKNDSLIINKNKQEIHIDDSAAPIKDDKGNIKGVILVFRDITKHKKLEEKLRQSQKMEAIGTLTGGVAHDFNNIMTAIQVSTELTLMEISDSTLKENDLYNTLLDINRHAKHGSELTRQLLQFSSKHPMQPIKTDLNFLIENILKMLERLISEDIRIQTVLDPDLLPVKIDQGTIKQVILNLALNAQEAMPDGGELTIKTENYVLKENEIKENSDIKPGQFVSFSILDTGIGMDQEVLKHIFEPFFTTKKVGMGSGLGLSVVHGIVKQHKGWLTVDSKPDEGTTFVIYLPVYSEKPQESTQKEENMEIKKGKGERILVVEDDEIILKYVEKTLIKNGYTVFSALNSNQALKIFKNEKGKFDILFSDVVLPGKNGIKLADKFLSLNPELRVILSSGYSEPKSKGESIHEKNFHYIEKPYKINHLLSLIQTVLHS
ncbi:MAG: response regulator [bacterium]